MRILLFVYFTFSIVADPWIDGQAMAFDSHNEIEISAETSQATRNATDQTFSIEHNQDSHHHNDCPESCPEHTCHLGHCGVIVGERMPSIPPAPKAQFCEYRQSVPNSPIFGIRRPPKSIA